MIFTKGLCTIKSDERLYVIKGGHRYSIHTSEISSHCVTLIKSSYLLLACECNRKKSKKRSCCIILWFRSLVTTTQFFPDSVKTRNIILSLILTFKVATQMSRAIICTHNICVYTYDVHSCVILIYATTACWSLPLEEHQINCSGNTLNNE